MARVAKKKTLPPTRMEKAGEEFVETSKSLNNKLPYWAKSALCVKCGGLLAPIKAKADTQYGETITFQCHNMKNGKMCLLVVQVTESVSNMMRPGDFHPSDVGWKHVAPETVSAEVAEAAVSPVEFEGPKVAPDSPWQRKTVLSALWDGFWLSYMSNTYRPVADKEFVMSHAIAVKGASFTQKIKEELENLPEWMNFRTGYVISLSNGAFSIVGKTQGGEGITALPYSDPKYRKKFGFE